MPLENRKAPWSKEDKKFLFINFHKYNLDKLALELRRTPAAVERMYRTLKSLPASERYITKTTKQRQEQNFCEECARLGRNGVCTVWTDKSACQGEYWVDTYAAEQIEKEIRRYAWLKKENKTKKKG